jgi:hypothetical protein
MAPARPNQISAKAAAVNRHPARASPERDARGRHNPREAGAGSTINESLTAQFGIIAPDTDKPRRAGF